VAGVKLQKIGKVRENEMTDLRNPQLRVRDLRRLVEPKLHSVVWDPGLDTENEWVYASVESDAHRSKLLDWLNMKGIDGSEEALRFDRGWSQPRWVLWRYILQKPEDFFSGTPFSAVGVDLSWTIDYLKEGVARFGRWPTVR
jgi:hypothetical protein